MSQQQNRCARLLPNEIGERMQPRKVVSPVCRYANFRRNFLCDADTEIREVNAD